MFTPLAFDIKHLSGETTASLARQVKMQYLQHQMHQSLMIEVLNHGPGDTLYHSFFSLANQITKFKKK